MRDLKNQVRRRIGDLTGAPDLKRKGLKVTQPRLLPRCATGIILRSVINIHVGAHMRKAIVACFAIAFLTSPLHAEDKNPGSGFLEGATKGAGAGGGPHPTVQDTQMTNQKPEVAQT